LNSEFASYTRPNIDCPMSPSPPRGTPSIFRSGSSTAIRASSRTGQSGSIGLVLERKERQPLVTDLSASHESCYEEAWPQKPGR
jgi:hypothetical protein